MRRFPPPPGSKAAGPVTPLRRSTEAPMQFEWEQPRTYPASPFATASAGADDDGERAKKRTHYEAMDVDTPPRPSFPPSATATTNPFHFANPPPASEGCLPDGNLAFDSSNFDPKDAFGLSGAEVDAEQEVGDESMLDEEKGEEATSSALSVIGGGESRHRKGGTGVGTASRRDRSPERRRRTTGGDEDQDGEGAVLGGRRMQGSEFSFQVHHHHAGEGGAATPLPERWLNSNTPYTLLGYLQFGSLTLLAVLFLFISCLFLYTLYADIQARLASLTTELRAEILQCAKAYVDNRCEPATRIPAMERRCSGWEECMGREVVVVGKTRVVAETLAEVVNGFVDVISFKTMFFVILTLGLCIYGSSVALSILPARSSATTPFSHHPQASPSAAAPPHFQHLGYGYPPYGYAGLPSPGFGAPWTEAQNKEAESRGLNAPPLGSGGK